MRVLHVSTWKTRCGIANYTETLVNQLARRGIDSDVFPLATHEMHTMVESDLTALVAAIGQRARDSDLVHLQHEFGFYSSPTTTSSIVTFGNILDAIKRAARPAVATFHTDPDYSISIPTNRRKLRQLVLAKRWQWRVARHFRNRASAAQALTHTMRGRQALVNSGFDSARVSTVPMGHEMRAVPSSLEIRNAAKAQLGLEPNSVLMSIFGFIGTYKGHEVAMQALRALPPKFVLAIIGGRHPDAGEDPALNNILRAWRKRDPKRLLITGYADRPTVELYQAETDICLAPYRPAFNLSASAALTWCLTSGRPTIASAIPSFREVNHRGDCLMLVTPGAPFELAWAIERLAGDEPTQARLVQNSLRYAEANSWQVVAERTADIYAQVLTRHGTGARASSPIAPRQVHPAALPTGQLAADKSAA
jgi:glycosyltransferase involved in cell wall biosynthesis